MATSINEKFFGDSGRRKISSTSGEDDTGLVTGNVTYEVHPDYLYSTLPFIGMFHPDDPRSQLFKLDIDHVAPYPKVNCEYIGISSGTRTSGNIEWIANASEEPIETHPDFESVLAGTPASPKNEAKFDPETDEFIAFTGDSEFLGVTGYLSPSVTLRFTYYSKSLNVRASRLGRKDSPQTSPYKNIELSGRNWLYLGASYRNYGTFLYEISKEWMMSGPNGWNKTIY